MDVCEVLGIVSRDPSEGTILELGRVGSHIGWDSLGKSFFDPSLQEVRGGAAGWWSLSLGFFPLLQTFLCASRKPQNIFCFLSKLHVQEAPKHILFPLKTPCTGIPSNLTLKISPLTSFLSKVV